MSVEDKILKLNVDNLDLPTNYVAGYNAGKSDASMFAKAVDELMAEMAEEHSAAMHEAGELMKLMADELGCYADNPETREVLDVYNEYKEQNQ